MSAKKRRKRRKKKSLLPLFTAVFLLLSGAAFGAKYYLSNHKLNEEHNFSAEYVHSDSMLMSGNLDNGAILSRQQKAVINEGEGYVRFTVEIADIDGTPINEALEKLQADIEEVESSLNPESPSYEAFIDSLYSMKNQYNLLKAKGEAAWQLIIADNDDILPQTSISNFALEKLVSDGLVVPLMSNEEYQISYDVENPYVRTFTLKHSLKKGEECLLFSDIVIPNDYTQFPDAIDVYLKNENGEYQCIESLISKKEILGSGFMIKASAEAVDAYDSETPEAAFSKAALNSKKN